MEEVYYFENERYEKIEATISGNVVNKKAAIWSIITTILTAVCYEIIWDVSYWHHWSNYVVALLFYVLLIIAHEGLHAIGYVFAGKTKWSSIKFGVLWEYMMPYAHCKVMISVQAYRFALLLPLVVTGIIPLVVGFAIGNGLLVLVGMMLTQSAAGDVMVYRLLKKYPRQAIVKDHPSEIGCEVYIGKDFVY